MPLPLRLALGALVACAAAVATAAPAVSGLRLARVTTAYAPGDAVGAIHAGSACGEATSREWSDLLQRRVHTELSRAFADELAKVPAARADVAVSAHLSDLKVQLCDLGHGAWQGGFEVSVQWQMQRGRAAGPTYQARTSGRFQHQAGAGGLRPDAGLRAAFAQSVRQLLAAPQFAAATRGVAADRQIAQATGN